MATNSNDTKMVRDSLGGVLPQTLNDNGTYSVMANGDVSNVDFSKKKLLRDHLGGVLPQQYYDVDKGQFVPGKIGDDSNTGDGAKIHSSTLAPTPRDGNDGDLWIKYKEA